MPNIAAPSPVSSTTGFGGGTLDRSDWGGASLTTLRLATSPTFRDEMRLHKTSSGLNQRFLKDLGSGNGFMLSDHGESVQTSQHRMWV
jgi:hypothetical protein